MCWRKSTYSFSQHLIIRPGYFRRGIGRSLYESASNEFKDVSKFILVTDDNDSRLYSIYQELGMRTDINSYPLNTYFRQNDDG